MQSTITLELGDHAKASLNVGVAEEAKAEAMQRVENNASDTWLASAKDAWRYVAERRMEFTTDAVWGVLEGIWLIEPPHEPRAMGVIAKWAVSQRLCIAEQRMIKSIRLQNHRRPIVVYRSLVYGKGAAR